MTRAIPLLLLLLVALVVLASLLAGSNDVLGGMSDGGFW